MIYREPGISPSYDLAPPTPPLPSQQVVSLYQSSYLSPRACLREWGGRGGGRSQIMRRRRESLVIYKEFNTLWTAITVNANAETVQGLIPASPETLESGKGGRWSSVKSRTFFAIIWQSNNNPSTYISTYYSAFLLKINYRQCFEVFLFCPFLFL